MTVTDRRRTGATIAAVSILAAVLSHGARANSSGAPLPRPDELDADVKLAVAAGLDWLARHQLPTGGFTGSVGFKRRQSYAVTYEDGEHIGVTALAGMAFLAGGHLPGRGRYGDEVERAITFVVERSSDFGYLSHHGTRMYSHAFATLFLAEVLGMSRRPGLEERLQAAIDLIVSAQNDEGAWRYERIVSSSDMSVTVCQLMALRAAHNAGIRVPKSTIDRAVKYVRDSQARDWTDARFRRYPAGYYRSSPGAFRYQIWGDQRSSYALTAAGITSLYHAGEYDVEDLEAGLSFLEQTEPMVSERWFGHYFYYYGHYYAAQAYFIAGQVGGHDYWSAYWQRISKELIERQSDDGSWENHTGPGPAFGTAVACVVLQVPNRYLPVLQR